MIASPTHSCSVLAAGESGTSLEIRGGNWWSAPPFILNPKPELSSLSMVISLIWQWKADRKCSSLRQEYNTIVYINVNEKIPSLLVARHHRLIN